MNKRGMLLAEETLKVVIAVIAIGFLVYFLASLYFSNLNEKDQKQAEATLERVSEIIESSENGEVRAINPSGWYLFSFTELEKPNSCAGKNCLCICENKWPLLFTSEIKKQAKECSDDGRCLIIENLETFEEIEIEVGTNIGIISLDNKILVEEIE